jgi:cytochrome c
MYANWLAQKDDLQIGIIYPGRGIPMIYDTSGLGSSILAGEKVYNDYCVMCHGENAWGGMGPLYEGEEPPPIAGPNSFNAAATSARRPRLAGFIYNNMPPGATHDEPILSIQQALDVALYLQSLGRPSDFVHTNQVATLLNYLWQNLVYHGYTALKYLRDLPGENRVIARSFSGLKQPAPTSTAVRQTLTSTNKQGAKL